MEDRLIPEKQKKRPEILFAGGCLAVLFLALLIFSAVFVGNRILAESPSTPTLTATVAVTPQVLIQKPGDEWMIRHEDFSSDDLGWTLYFPPGKLQIVNGQLVLETYSPDRSVIASSQVFFAPSDDIERYYVQADFTTDVETSLSYGLVFGLSDSFGSFYLFEIWRDNGLSRLLKYSSGGWEELVAFTEVELRPYPEFNTLSVYFDEGNIELYTNGVLAATYKDENLFRSKNIGAFIGEIGVRLIVDDFFVYDER